MTEKGKGEKREQRGEKKSQKRAQKHKGKGRGRKGDGMEAMRRRRQADSGQEERFKARRQDGEN